MHEAWRSQSKQLGNHLHNMNISIEHEDIIDPRKCTHGLERQIIIKHKLFFPRST